MMRRGGGERDENTHNPKYIWADGIRNRCCFARAMFVQLKHKIEFIRLTKYLYDIVVSIDYAMLFNQSIHLNLSHSNTIRWKVGEWVRKQVGEWGFGRKSGTRKATIKSISILMFVQSVWQAHILYLLCHTNLFFVRTIFIDFHANACATAISENHGQKYIFIYFYVCFYFVGSGFYFYWVPVALSEFSIVLGCRVCDGLCCAGNSVMV